MERSATIGLVLDQQPRTTTRTTTRNHFHFGNTVGQTLLRTENNRRSMSLTQHLLNHIPPHAGETLVEPLVEVCEPRVVEAPKVKNSGMQI